MLIIQLALAIWAFFRGWRWWAAFPVGLVIVIGFMEGIIEAFQGTSIPGFEYLDTILIIVLGYMVINRKEGEEK
jgi:hypothetical protein